MKDGDESKTVAIKEPHFGGAVTTEVVERFSEEAELWSHLEHGNIVTLHDWDTEPSPWIALEYADEGTLREYIDGRTAKLEHRLWIAVCLARALKYAHNRGLMHFDLKPENVLFKSTPEDTWSVPKITDWGLAKLLLKHSGEVEGLSFHYAAPEQLKPDEYDGTDERTDIYQLGALIYALLTGRPPVEGSKREIAEQILAGDIRPPSALNSSLPGAVDRVLMKALSSAGNDRYEDMLLFQHALEELFLDVHAITNTRQPRVDVRRSGTTGSPGPATEVSLNWCTESAVVPSGPPAVVDDTVYLTTKQGTVHLLSVHSGDVEWGKNLSDTPLTAPVVTERRFYSATQNGGVYALSQDSTEASWQGRVDGRIRSPPLLLDDILYLTTLEGEVLAIDFPDTTVWRTRVPGNVHAPVSARSGILLVPTFDTLVALDANKGNTKWEYNADDPYKQAAAVSGDSVYACGSDGVTALTLETGDEQWVTETDDSPTGVAATTNYVFVSTAGGAIIALDMATGEIEWQDVQPNQRVTAPVCTTDQVFVGYSAASRKSLPSRMDDVRAFDLETGTPQWSFATDAQVELQPVVAGNTLLVLDTEGTLYSLQ